jgi:hypothetical protein
MTSTVAATRVQSTVAAIVRLPLAGVAGRGDGDDEVSRACSRRHLVERQGDVLGLTVPAGGDMLNGMRSRVAPKRYSLALTVLLGALAVVPAASAQGIPDQVNDPQTGVSFGCGNLPLFQGFLPSRRLLSAVQLRLHPGETFPAGGTSFPVRIRRGSPGGEVVGQATASVPGPIPVGTTVLVQVDFAPALVLEPEGTFVIEGPLADIGLFWSGTSMNPYSRGTAFGCQGEPVENTDFNFITFTPRDTGAPQTRISTGPKQGSSSRVRSIRVAFAGADDLSYASKLRFACTLDGSPSAACISPYTASELAQGRHVFSVQASDEAGKVDASPAVVSWTVDATPPRKPTVRGPRTTQMARARFLFAASDKVDPVRKLHFLCSLNSRRLRPCARSFSPRLRRGLNLLRVAAVDRAGNRSATTIVRVVRLLRKGR